MSNSLDYPNVHGRVLSLARSTESEFGRTLFHALLSLRVINMTSTRYPSQVMNYSFI
jgi:hypothetical protein